MSAVLYTKKYPPGSPKAVAKGCTCPVLDNGHGRGAQGTDGTMYWVAGDCQLHGPKREHKVSQTDTLRA